MTRVGSPVDEQAAHEERGRRVAADAVLEGRDGLDSRARGIRREPVTPLTPPRGSRSWVDEGAELYAAEPETVAQVLSSHHDRDGRCSACGLRSSWPCAVVTIARRARHLIDAELRRLPSTVERNASCPTTAASTTSRSPGLIRNGTVTTRIARSLRRPSPASTRRRSSRW